MGMMRMVLVLLFLASAPVAAAQQIPHATADSLVTSGLAAFEAGSWSEAQADFDRVLREYSSSTAASTSAFMAARSAYRLGQYARAASLVRSFADTYPDSRFTSDAARLLALAENAQDVARLEPARLGIILSLDGEDRLQTQEMFNGIHLAVRRHNAAETRRPVEMIFRDADGGPDAVRRAVQELAAENADAIFGTLYSENAIAAAAEAERQGLVFMAPMATDEAVSRGRRMAFQANPSMEVRGRLAARHAVNGLRLDSLGVIASMDPAGLSERITDAFIQEASRLGARINLIVLLPEERNWLELDNFFPADTLDHVEALFMPIVSPDRQRVAGGVLSSMDRFGKTTRIVGNSSWHDLPMTAHASQYGVSYVNDYYSGYDERATAAFIASFRTLARTEPDRLAFAGYDGTTFLLGLMDTYEAAELADAIRQAPPFQGLGHRIHFDGTNVNQGMFYHRYRDGRLVLQR